MSSDFFHPGMATQVNEFGMRVVFLHYTADPWKSEGGKVEREHNGKTLLLTPWSAKEFDEATDKSWFLQEYEVAFEAKQGELVYFLHDEATLEKSFPIPEDWTRYFVLDPHPGKPHACLWGAVNRWGELVIYREFWPSKVYGKPGNVPGDDNRTTPRDYTECLKYLESADNPQNCVGEHPFNERITKRIIDYAARGFGHTANDELSQSNYQKRFEDAMQEFGLCQPFFEDCVKNGDAGVDAVNEWLKPRDVDDGGNGFVPRSRIRIFSDRCPELIYQLKTNRREQLTPTQAEKKDPTGKPIDKRNDLTDCIKYLVAANPQYIEPVIPASDWKPIHEGISY